MSRSVEIQEAVAKARAALEAGKMDEVKSWREKAEELRKMDQEASALDDIARSVNITQPVLPNTGGAPAAVPSIDSNKGGSTAVLDPPGNPSGESGDQGTLSQKTQRAAYATRFGSEESVIKGILTDLHGGSYEALYWDQKATFNKYLRRGEEFLDREEMKLLRNVIMNPAAVKMALQQGVGDISSFRATMVEAADSLGGILVPVDFQMRMIQRLAALTVIRGRASQMNTSRDQVQLPEATGGDGRFTSPVRVQWVDETPTIGQLTPNYLTFGLRSINIHTAMAEAPMSRNLLDDTAFDIEGFLATKFAEAVALDEDRQFTIGNGVGKPKGILPQNANTMGLTEVMSGAASTLTWNGLMAMTYGIDAQYRQAGVWLGNRNTFLAIAQMQDSTSGAYLWQPYQYVGGTDGRLNTLLGYPILESELMADVGAAAYPLLFGDLSAYTIIDRLGMTVERFLDSQTARQNLVYFVCRRRLGGELVETWKMVTQKVGT